MITLLNIISVVVSIALIVIGVLIVRHVRERVDAAEGICGIIEADAPEDVQMPISVIIEEPERH